MCCAIFIEEELALSLVVDNVCIALNELLQFLLAGSNGKSSTIGAFHAEAGIGVNRFDLGDLLGVEISHWEAQPTLVALLLASNQGFDQRFVLKSLIGAGESNCLENLFVLRAQESTD